MKFNDGLAVTLMVGVSLLGLPRSRRTLAVAVGAFAASAVLAWLALGQPLGALPDYVRTGIAISRGYVDSMGYDAMGTNGDWEVLVVVASALALAAGGWLSLAGYPRRQRAALAATVLLVHYFVAREMFVRYDGGHAAVISLLIVVPLAIPWQLGRARLAFASAAALAVAAVAVLGLAGLTPGSIFDPFGRAGRFDGQLGTVFSPADAIAQGRAAIQALRQRAAGDRQRAQRALRGRGPGRDRGGLGLSAVALVPGRRDAVLRRLHPFARPPGRRGLRERANRPRPGAAPGLREIDARNPAWESPAAMLSLLCHFKEIGRGGNWQALARIPDRCGRPRVLGTIHSPNAATVTIPPAPRGWSLSPRSRASDLSARAPRDALRTGTHPPS